MTAFQLRSLFLASSFALALPTMATAGSGQNTSGSGRAEQVAQSQAEQERLPAKKEGSSNTPTQSARDPEADKGAQAEQKRLPAAKDRASTNGEQTPVGKGGHSKVRKHPPTAAMDRATPEEKSSSATGTPGKHPPARAMDRATPDQKSPEPAAAK